MSDHEEEHGLVNALVDDAGSAFVAEVPVRAALPGDLAWRATAAIYLALLASEHWAYPLLCDPLRGELAYRHSGRTVRLTVTIEED